MNTQEPNFVMSGDDARLLMTALATSSANIPAYSTVALWTRLNEISQVQPPQPKN